MDDNWYALVIAILLKQPPEAAFQIYEVGKKSMTNSVLDDNDTLDMMKFRNEGISYSAIGQMYGISQGAVHHRIQYYLKHKKNRPVGAGTANRNYLTKNIITQK